MAHTAVVIFTARSRQDIVEDGGSRDWRLDADRARRSEFLVCTQNRHNPDQDFGAPDAPHGAAFLIGRVADVVPSTEPGRWLIRIDSYVACDIPNMWSKLGHARYPVRYTTLEELGIDLSQLPPFRPIHLARGSPGLREMSSPALVPPLSWQAHGPAETAPDRRRQTGGEDSWARLDALLHQIDRVPDQPSAFDPLIWDNNGLPR